MRCRSSSCECDLFKQDVVVVEETRAPRCLRFVFVSNFMVLPPAECCAGRWVLPPRPAGAAALSRPCTLRGAAAASRAAFTAASTAAHMILFLCAPHFRPTILRPLACFCFILFRPACLLACLLALFVLLPLFVCLLALIIGFASFVCLIILIIGSASFICLLACSYYCFAFIDILCIINIVLSLLSSLFTSSISNTSSGNSCNSSRSTCSKVVENHHRRRGRHYPSTRGPHSAGPHVAGVPACFCLPSTGPPRQLHGTQRVSSASPPSNGRLHARCLPRFLKWMCVERKMDR